jgi:hypothetical protein
VALHAVRLDDKHRELSIVGGAVSTPITGEAIHGAGDAWLGHLTVRAAVEAGLRYSELAPSVADCPYAGYPWVGADGLVGAERIIGVTYNISIEGRLGVRPGSEGGPGIYRQILNHPDLNFDRLSGWVEALPDEPRVDLTCEQLAGWWQATHVSEALNIVHRGAGPQELRFLVSAVAGAQDLELRIPCPPGSVSAVIIDGADAEWGELDEPEQSGIRVRLSLPAGGRSEVLVRSSASDPSEADEAAGAARTAFG